MRIRRRPFRPASASEEYSLDRGELRSPGIHVMSIVSSIEETLVRPSDAGRNASAEDLELYASGGFLWERVVAQAMAEADEHVFHPGEFAWCPQCHGKDGAGFGAAMPGSWGRRHAIATGHKLIYGTPDGMTNDATSNAEQLEEYKWTWKSESRAVTLQPSELGMDGKVLGDEWRDDVTLEFGMWRWGVQVKSYSYMLGFTAARMRTVFCNGNYRPMVPRAWEFQIDMDRAELEENWQMLVRHARSKGWIE